MRNEKLEEAVRRLRLVQREREEGFSFRVETDTGQSAFANDLRLVLDALEEAQIVKTVEGRR